MPTDLTSERTETSTIDAVAHCTEFVSARALETDFSTARVREIELVVEEVVDNICRHSYGDQLGSVELCCRQLDGEKLELEFVDYGRPFDILAVPAPDLSVSLEQRDLGGIGVPMMRALVDRANYRRDGARNVLSLVFHAPCRLGAVATGA